MMKWPIACLNLLKHHWTPQTIPTPPPPSFKILRITGLNNNIFFNLAIFAHVVNKQSRCSISVHYSHAAGSHERWIQELVWEKLIWRHKCGYVHHCRTFQTKKKMLRETNKAFWYPSSFLQSFTLLKPLKLASKSLISKSKNMKEKHKTQKYTFGP